MPIDLNHLWDAVADMAEKLGDGMTAGHVGPQMTCSEADSIASVLAAAGHTAAAAAWLSGHAIGLGEGSDEPDDDHWRIVTAAYGLPEDAEVIPDGAQPDYPKATLAARQYLTGDEEDTPTTLIDLIDQDEAKGENDEGEDTP